MNFASPPGVNSWARTTSKSVRRDELIQYRREFEAFFFLQKVTAALNGDVRLALRPWYFGEKLSISTLGDGVTIGVAT